MGMHRNKGCTDKRSAQPAQVKKQKLSRHNMPLLAVPSCAFRPRPPSSSPSLRSSEGISAFPKFPSHSEQ
eukprot:32037-Pelagomonas_calceolata.AAC.2